MTAGLYATPATVPLTWRIGVDSAFGYVSYRDGLRLLCEHVCIVRREAVLVRLDSGERVFAPADGSCRWEHVDAADACRKVGIPAPEIDGAGEIGRRLDPFHVERNRSPRFCALVEAIRDHGLPAGYALLRYLAGDWDGTWQRASADAPEIFAAAVSERIARGENLKDAIRDELADDGRLEPDAVDEVLERTGWRTAIAGLDQAIARHTARLYRDTPAELPDHTGGQRALM